VVGVRDDGYSPCRVHWIGYATTLDAWVPLSYLRPSGAGVVQPIPGGATAFDPTLDSIQRHGAPAPRPTRVALGRYACFTFASNHLVPTGEFALTSATTYQSGSTRGGITFDAAASVLRFQG